MINRSTLVWRNLLHFWRTNLAVILGVATAVAVLSGALLVGSSVRASLRDLAVGRLGKTDAAIVSPGFFREDLASELSPQVIGIAPLIQLEAEVRHEENGRRAYSTSVYGVDERFYSFNGFAPPSNNGDEALVSAALAGEIGSRPGDQLVVRVEKPSAIPRETMHGRKDDVGTTIRLVQAEQPTDAATTEFSLRPQQSAVRAIFVPLRRLQRSLGQENRVNTLLAADRPGQASLIENLRSSIKEHFQLTDVGLKLRMLDGKQQLALESESAILGDYAAAKAREAATGLGLKTHEYLTYLVNSMKAGQREVPYSLVTAIGPEYSDQFKHDWSDGTPPIEINSWTAKDLGIQASGTDIELEYYIWQEQGGLQTRSTRFRVSSIVGVTGFADDRDFAPDYPGITEANSLSDWDPPFPIDLGRIRKQDEEYWKQHRTTPKAFIQLEDAQKLWGTRYGKLTSVRVDGASDIRQSYEARLRGLLDPSQMGLTVLPVRSAGLEASKGATDFGEYFAYFSFFLVAAALLLAILFFRLGIEQRLREIGLLRAIGFPPSGIRRMFLLEGVILALLGSMLGMAGAVAYGLLMIHGLRTWWIGAVGTTALKLHVSPVALLSGSAAIVFAALVCVFWTLRGLGSASPRALLAGTLPISSKGRRSFLSSRWVWAALAAVIAIGLLGLSAAGLIGQVGGFFGAGALLLISMLFFEWGRLRREHPTALVGRGDWQMVRIGFRSAQWRPGRSILCISLIASAVFVVVAVEAFRRDSNSISLERRSGSGGFRLLAQSLLPIVYDPNTTKGREDLSLDAERELKDVKFERFRVHTGDDTSCLNLYQPHDPRILAPGHGFIENGGFAFQESVAQTTEEKQNPWLLLEKETGDGSIPVIADANSMTYVLHRKLGDEMTVSSDNGELVRVRLVAALSDSIFQSELLMSERNFTRLFPGEAGYRFFLIDVSADEASTVSETLERQLSDFGFDVSSTADRLASFHRVENTYLSTFQALGGLGLALGTLGLAAIMLRNVLERRRELALLRAMGYGTRQLGIMVVSESGLLVGLGLIIGTICALIAIAPAAFARGAHLPGGALWYLLLAVVAAGLITSLLTVAALSRSRLLAALQSE